MVSFLQKIKSVKYSFKICVSKRIMGLIDEVFLGLHWLYAEVKNDTAKISAIKRFFSFGNQKQKVMEVNH